MKILLICMEYDYGDENRGRSYEYYNFYKSLSLNHSVEIFDYMQLIKKHGKINMNSLLLNEVQKQDFDVAIFSLYTDQLDTKTVELVREHTRTLCFFHDDTWRRDFVNEWAPHFDFFTSTDYNYFHRYKLLGLNNVIHFPFGANQHLYRYDNIEKIYDISFVGGWNPTRAWLIKRLQKNGYNVYVRGHGWPGGIVDHSEMVRIFNASRINLNLSNSMSWDIRLFLSDPIGALRQLRSGKNVEQLKARHFEINSCGGFQLSYYVDGLENAYKLGSEIAIFLDADDLIEKVGFYLNQEELRHQIAECGLQRTLNEHTYNNRFQRVFTEMGLFAK